MSVFLDCPSCLSFVKKVKAIMEKFAHALITKFIKIWFYIQFDEKEILNIDNVILSGYAVHGNSF